MQMELLSRERGRGAGVEGWRAERRELRGCGSCPTRRSSEAVAEGSGLRRERRTGAWDVVGISV